MITKILLFSLFSLMISSCELSGMDKNSINTTIDVHSPQITYDVELQENGWACGYRSIFNAWLIKENKFIGKNLNLKIPTPSFEQWINLMKEKWVKIFGEERPFMNGKYDNEGQNTLKDWLNNEIKDQRCLQSNDIELLVCLAFDNSDQAATKIKEFISYIEHSNSETNSILPENISIMDNVEFKTSKKWPNNEHIQNNIIKFQHNKEIQIILLNENFHWTSMILIHNQPCYILDSLNVQNRSIHQIAYSMFVINSFPKEEYLRIFFNQCKRLKKSEKRTQKNIKKK